MRRIMDRIRGRKSGLSRMDSAILVEYEQVFDQNVMGCFGIAVEQGNLNEQQQECLVYSFLSAMEIDCELAARWS